MKSNLLCFVFGTRPEIIKMNPLFQECKNAEIPFITIHTGQHYSESMDAIFFQTLGIAPPSYRLNCGSGTHAYQTARMLIGIEEILIAKRPSIVVVQGDTNSSLAGALAAAKLQIPVAHVEAGLRSWDRTMPEEINRVLIGHLARWHFVPTHNAKQNLVREGILEDHIYLVGNTISDCVRLFFTKACRRSTILHTLSLFPKTYLLATIHRPENTDTQEKISIIVSILKDLAAARNMTVVWPIHPRTRIALEKFNLLCSLQTTASLFLLEPLDYLDTLVILANAKAVLTDSGGIQEEACILGTPCVTIRNSTERPETIEVGANELVPCREHAVRYALEAALTKDKEWRHPYGDGHTAMRIIRLLRS